MSDFWSDQEDNFTTLSELYPRVAKMYASENKVLVDKVNPYTNLEYLWVCQRCKKSFKRRLDWVIKGKIYCRSCSSAMGKLSISLREAYPEVADRYDAGGNIILSTMVSPISSMKAKFLCPNLGKPHIYETSINHAVTRFGTTLYQGCIICAGRKIVAGVNDLPTMETELFKMFSPSNTINPQEVGWRDSKKLIKWVCPEGHEFEQTVSEQKKYISTKYKGCPYCAGRKVAKGVNDLKSLFPDVYELWDFEKNTVDPSIITGRSYEKKCWFKCPKGHSWEALTYGVIASRTHSSRGCPYCANQKVLKGYNDLESQNPELLKYWDYSENDILPSEVGATDQNHKYFFRCSEGHSFQSSVYIMLGSLKYKSKGCPVCANKQVEIGVNDLLTTHPFVRDIFPYDINPDVDPVLLVAGSDREINCYCANYECENTFKTSVYNWVNGFVKFCPDCRNCGKSVEAHELAEAIRGLGVDVEEEVALWNDKRRVDILIPSHNLVIEYNGLYWHNANIRGKNYHLDRLKSIKSKGYDVVYVWQDDWVYKGDIVISGISRKLGISSEEKVNARDCHVDVINLYNAKGFLESYHIQGFVSGDEYLGVFDKYDNLRAVCVIEGRDNVILIKRYATDCILRGGFSKVLKYIDVVYDYTILETFSDNCVSDGSLYEKLGFVPVKIISPDYKYIVNHRRVHKFNYRIDRFKRDSNLEYIEGLSETELASLNGINRIWDAGKVKWQKRK